LDRSARGAPQPVGVAPACANRLDHL